jgi:plastocyanin
MGPFQRLCLPLTVAATIHHINAGPGFVFSPLGTVVSPGDTVRWHDISGNHTSTADATSPKFWDSGLMNPGDSFDVVFTITDGPGPFPYHCTPHVSLGMRDTIWVAPASCCQGIRGNTNGDVDDKVNILDITYIVSYLFGTPQGPAPPCQEEGNANGDSEEKINILDVTYLVSYLFGTPQGPAPPACP